ncbi:MAG: hypothetical protein IJT94_11515 [Oscillibacter sp.]|nr:hypothetical protein [Oscillibacter sp.]
MIVTYVLHKDDKPTPEQIAQLKKAATHPIEYDEDCPPLTEEQLAIVRRAMAEIKTRPLRITKEMRERIRQELIEEGVLPE